MSIPTLPRAQPCLDCPFLGRGALERVWACREPGTARSPEMLCHESGSLDGDREDYACRGADLAEGRTE